jgi:hypothetical protein
MKTFLTILLGMIIGMVGLYYFTPIKEVFALGQSNFGASITTIAGTDTISSSRVTINDNFSALNNNKIEMSTTSVASITTLSGLTTAGSLATVGTISSGIWNGTAILSTYGGTGTTSFPAYHLIVASSTGAGLTVVSGTGSSGQFLTSQGASAYPQWTTSSVDQGLDYSWTGEHDYSASTTFSNLINITSSSTINAGMRQDGVFGGIVPTGSIVAYVSSTAPAGWLVADGTAVSRTTYANLFAIISTTYGIGDGSTTFNLPDIRGRNILMASSTANMAQTGGESNHTMTSDELVAHTHTISAYNTTSNGTSGVRGSDTTGSFTPSTGSTGSSVPFNVLDPYITAYYIIKY